MFRNIVFQNFPFLENDFDALTDYELFCKMMEYVKQQVEGNEELEKRIKDLENYVYNLDLQEEVDNKLEEMAEDGTLQELITQYVNLKSVLAFNNINDLKNGTNLVNGSVAKTLGNASYNDGYGSFYFIRNIRNDDVVDNINIIALNNSETLIAEKIYNQDVITLLNRSQYGYKGNNTLFYEDIDNFKTDLITDNFPQGNYLLYINIDGTIECAIVSKASNNFLTFLYLGYDNLITQYHYVDNVWSNEVYANINQINQLNNKIQYGLTGNNELYYTSINDFKTAIITDAFPEGNYMLFVSISGERNTYIVSKASNNYLSFISFGYDTSIIQYKYLNGTWQ